MSVVPELMGAGAQGEKCECCSSGDSARALQSGGWYIHERRGLLGEMGSHDYGG